MVEESGVKDVAACRAAYHRETREERREELLPFLWAQIKSGGWAAGDWHANSKVLITNGHYFSYPGYSELLCGYADARIDSNDKRYNPNTTVLEWLNQQSPFTGQVYAFGSWDVFPFIINDKRSGVPVNAGWRDLEIGDPAAIAAYNDAARNMVHEWDGVRYDVFTAAGALQAMQAKTPRVLYVALGEPDDWAHAGRYDRYLSSSRKCDDLIRQLWEMAQRLPAYKDRTAFLVATDHGRGDGREGWKNHSNSLPGSERIWVVAFGAGIQRSGVDQGGEYQQAQVAATVAAVLGQDFTPASEKIAPPLPCAPTR